MGIEIKLPDLGEGIESGDILDILVAEGDTVEKDQGIVEIETDKATVEVPSTHAGKVVKLHVSIGDSVSVGRRLVTLEAAEVDLGTPPKTSPAAGTESPAEESPAEAVSDAAPQSTSETHDSGAVESQPAAVPASPADSPPVPTPPSPPARRPPPSPAQERRLESEPTSPTVAVSVSPAETPVRTPPAGPIPAGPAIRRFAREVGVNLAGVNGTGNGGRITRDDVLQVVRHANRMAQGGAKTAEGVEGEGPQLTVPGTPSEDSWGIVGLEKTSKIRKTIAAKMFESWSTVPRVTNFDDADVTELERIRQTSKQDYAAKDIKLTAMPFIIKAVSMALQRHPLLNASLDLDHGQIIYKQYVNVGIAIDTDRGLVVPALRNTDQKSIAMIAKELAAIAIRIRNNEFGIEDLRGGTFTISNLGAIGGTYSTPVINVPEVAILLVGRSRKMPVVLDGEIVVRLMMPLSISYDHRIVDGAAAARFLNDVIDYLQAPGRLLLAP